LKHSNTGKDYLKIDAAKEVILETKKQLDLSNILDKFIHHYTVRIYGLKREGR